MQPFVNYFCNKKRTTRQKRGTRSGTDRAIGVAPAMLGANRHTEILSRNFGTKHPRTIEIVNKLNRQKSPTSNGNHI